MNRTSSNGLVLTCLLLALGACDRTGPNFGETRVVLNKGAVAGAFAAQVPSAWDETEMTAAQLLSVEVTVTGIDALPMGEDEEGQGGWVWLEVSEENTTLNLLDLPPVGETGLLLARGDLAAGSYGNLRIRFSDAFVTFAEAVTIGQATYPANEPIPLFVPSGAQTGIKLPQSSFTVGDGGTEIELVFDPERSAANIVPTGSGMVIMTPVIGVKQ